MRQVWILNHYAQEPGGIGGTRHFHLAECCGYNGWSATIIAASVEHQSGRQRLSAGESVRLERFSGIPFLWLRTPEYKGNGGGRMLNMLAYTWQALRLRVSRDLPRPDAVVGSSVHPFAAVAGALLARRFKVPFVFEVRDLWPQTLIDMGRLRDGSLMAWLLRRLELWLYRRAARIVVLLPKAWEYIVPLGISKERVVWIPNGVDLSLFPAKEPLPKTDAAHFTLMYFGAHGQANGLDIVLQAMALIQGRGNTRIRLRLIGDGPQKPELQALARKLALQNVQFEAAIPKKRIPLTAAEADAFVISVLDLPQLYRYGISMNKLFDYFAAGKPIVIASSAVNDPVEEAGAGISVPPGNPVALADAIESLADLPEVRRLAMGLAGRTYVERNHDFRALTEKFANTLNEALAEYK